MKVICSIHVLLSVLVVAGNLWAEPSPPFKVGIITPLTGSVASMGVAFRRGFELFQQDNSSCVSQSLLIFEDGRYDGKATTSAYQKLTSVDKVDLTIVWGNTPSGVCAPLAERKGAPLIAVAFTPEAKGRSHVVTFGPKTKLLATRTAEEFRKWGAKHPAAVSVNIGNALESIDYVKAALGEELDLRIVALEEVDFRSIITQLKAKGTDGVLAFLLPDQAITFAKQSVELGFTPPIIGGDVFADRLFGDKIGKILPRVAFVYSGVESAFIERLEKESFGSSYFYEVASGYSLAELVCRLGEKKQAEGSRSPLEKLFEISLIKSPIKGLGLLRDEEYGTHFENEADVYYVK